MKKSYVSFALLFIIVFNLVGCVKRLVIQKPQENCLYEENIWVKTKAFEWAKVLSIEYDSLLVETRNLKTSYEKKAVRVVSVHKSSIEQIEKREIDYFKTGLGFGIFAGFQIFWLIIANSFSDEPWFD